MCVHVCACMCNVCVHVCVMCVCMCVCVCVYVCVCVFVCVCVSITSQPVSSGVVAEVREEVIMQFPEDVQGDAAMRRTDGLVSFLQHRIKGVQRHKLQHHCVR